MEIIRNDLSRSNSEYNESDNNLELTHDDHKSVQSNHLRNQRIEVVFKKTFQVASLIGLHIFYQKSDGSYAPCYWKVVARILIFLFALFVCSTALYFAFLVQWGFYTFLISLPYWYNTIFCLGLYLSICNNYSTWKIYLTQMNMMKVVDNFSVNFRILWILSYTAVFMTTVLILIPPEWYFIVVPAVIICIVPAISDTYIGVFVYTISDGFKNLAKRTKNISVMNLPDIQKITFEWVYLRDILTLHNEVNTTLLLIYVKIFLKSSI